MTITTTLDDYSALVESAVDFEVEVTCPSQYISATLVTPIEPLLSYDLGDSR